MTQQQTPDPVRDRRFWLGIALLLFGAYWMLRELHIIPSFLGEYIFNFRNIFIIIGIYFIAARDKVGAGLIFLGIGIFFWLRYFDLIFLDWDLLLPAVVILIGFSLIAGRSIQRSQNTGADDEKQDFIDDFSLLGGRERTINSQSFRGGKVTALLGGSQIDMRNAELADGENVLDVFIMFGGSSLIVPPDWDVRVEVFSILGGFGDKRYSAVKVVPNPEKTLIIKGFVMFGGGEVSLTS